MTARCMRVREAHTLARSPHFPNLDRIYVSGSIAAVVDGATPKTTQASAGTEPFLDIVMGCLDALTCTPSSAMEFLADKPWWANCDDEQLVRVVRDPRKLIDRPSAGAQARSWETAGPESWAYSWRSLPDRLDQARRVMAPDIDASAETGEQRGT